MPIVVSTASTVVSLSQVRDYLNFDQGDLTEDTELTLFSDAAVAWVSTQVPDLTPPPVRLAILELIRHLYESQRGPSSGPLVDDGSFSLGLLGFAIPNRVKELLAPYIVQRHPVGSFPCARRWPDPADRPIDIW